MKSGSAQSGERDAAPEDAALEGESEDAWLVPRLVASTPEALRHDRPGDAGAGAVRVGARGGRV